MQWFEQAAAPHPRPVEKGRPLPSPPKWRGRGEERRTRSPWRQVGGCFVAGDSSGLIPPTRALPLKGRGRESERAKCELNCPCHPTIVMLAFAFLLMIGMVLIAEGFGADVPKGYISAAMAFSYWVGGLNSMARRKSSPK